MWKTFQIDWFEGLNKMIAGLNKIPGVEMEPINTDKLYDDLDKGIKDQGKSYNEFFQARMDQGSEFDMENRLDYSPSEFYDKEIENQKAILAASRKKQEELENLGGEGGTEGGGLGTTELDGNTLDTVVLGELWWDHANESIVDSEVSSTERNDTDHGNTETVVETHDSGWTGGGLLETVTEALEGTLAGTDIGGETGTGIVKWVDNGEGTGTGETTGGHVDGEERPEVLLWGVLWEHSLDGVLEGKVEGLGREIAQDVDEVATPESTDALLGRDAGEAVADAGVALDLAGDDARVRILQGQTDIPQSLSKQRRRLSRTRAWARTALASIATTPAEGPRRLGDDPGHLPWRAACGGGCGLEG